MTSSTKDNPQTMTLKHSTLGIVSFVGAIVGGCLFLLGVTTFLYFSFYGSAILYVSFYGSAIASVLAFLSGIVDLLEEGRKKSLTKCGVAISSYSLACLVGLKLLGMYIEQTH